MRRSVIYQVVSFLVITICIIGLIHVGANDDVQRYHQHLERPSAADLDECLLFSDEMFCTHLPIIAIDTFGAQIPGRPLGFESRLYTHDSIRAFHTTPDGETEIEVSVSVIDNANTWNHISDNPSYESLAMMRIRGNSSRFFDKPNYRISLIHSNAEDNPLPLLGMDPHAEWALHGPFLDKTLMRNYMWMNIAAEVMGPGHFVPEVRFFELILNGEYQGVYVLMETIRVSPNRVNLNRHRPNMPTTSFLTRLDTFTQTPDRKVNTFATYTHRLEGGNTMEILYPGRTMQSDSVREYVARNISTVERLLYSPEIIWNSRVYEQYIDVNSFINFYIINEFIANNDLWAGSTYIHKDVRGRLVAGPVWDFNNVMDNFFISMPVDKFLLADRGWFDRLMMCPNFTDRVIRRWHLLRRSTLSEERLISYMQEVEDWLGPAIYRNFEVWGYSFDPSKVSHMARRQLTYAEAAEGLTLRDVNPSSFEEAQEWARDYMIERGQWMDGYIETLRQFSHPSRHALWILQ